MPRTYQAGWFHRLLLGDLNRHLWSLEVEAPVLDLDSFAGGLTPIRRGGGLQTPSLRLQSAEGPVYTFRSLDKDASRSLGPGLRESVVADVRQDQIAALNPMAAAVVARLLEAAGVLFARPLLVVMPDDPRLGEYRETFADVLGWIEVRPDEGPDGQPGFAGADRVTGSEAFLDRLEEDPRNRLDARGYLRARLMDLYVGDWDRHPDQWRWAAFEEGDVTRWLPIPRDRDWALARIDGLFPRLSRGRWPQYVGFEARYTSVFGATWTGRALDRQLLSGLGRQDFSSVAEELTVLLTDEAIADAVARMPVSFRRAIGADLEAALRARRDGLVDAALEFYSILAAWVDVFVTDEPELASVERLQNGGVVVEVREILRDGRLATQPHFRREFVPGETREIRLFLRGGRDSVVVSGDGPPAITVHLVGGGGLDMFFDRTTGRGVKLYDDGAESRFDVAGATYIDTGAYEEPEDYESATHQARPRDWGSRFFAFTLAGASTDEGVFFGQRFHFDRYGFRHFPFETRLRLEYRVNPTLPGVRGEVEWDVPLGRSGWRGALFLDADTREVGHFYGFGNEAPDTADGAFYRADRGSVELGARVGYGLDSGVRVAFGPSLWRSWATGEEATLMESVRPYGYERMDQIGWGLDVTSDSRDNPVAASRGSRLTLRVRAVPPWLDTRDGYVRTVGYASINVPRGPAVFSFDAGATHVIGDPPHFDAATLGGGRSLRGYARDRFRGESSVFASAQVRTPIVPFFLLIPGEIGAHALTDVGRVFLDAEESDALHVGVGGGLHVSLVRPEHMGRATFVKGTDGWRAYFALDFRY